MSRVTTNAWGVVLILENQHLDELYAGVDVASTLAGFIGLVAPPVLPAVPVFVAYIKAYKAIIEKINRGHGVFLTLPWPAIALGNITAIIPTPMTQRDAENEYTKGGTSVNR